MAKAADFDGKANETEVVTSESVKGKRKTSILGTKARLWLITINNPQNHGISLEQAEILERFKEDIKTGRVTYVASVMEQSLTVDEMISIHHMDISQRITHHKNWVDIFINCSRWQRCKIARQIFYLSGSTC